MILQTIRLQHFRNHLNSEFSFGEGVNVLLGKNGQGKTNVLEAISYLCLTKSFYASGDAVVVRHEQENFEVEGVMQSESNIEHRIRVAFNVPQGRKAYFVNRKTVEPFSSVVGKFPVVICSPDHAPITMGSPMERRRFVNFVLSQDSPVYYNTLLEYQKVLKHRNKSLLDGKFSGQDTDVLLEPWNDQLVKLGSEIVSRRQKFTDEFQPYLQSAYRQIAGEEKPTMTYQTFIALEDIDEKKIQLAFTERLRERRIEEKRVGATLAGPHRDEFIFKLNGDDLRKFASQGQHKTFLVALKIAEFFYLKERRNETPIMLLDDVFSELDETRATRLLCFISSLGQTFLTSTYLQLFDRLIDFGVTSKRFFIESGTVVEQKATAVA
jgi:DNA replication and repair protein RecF